MLGKPLNDGTGYCNRRFGVTRGPANAEMPECFPSHRGAIEYTLPLWPSRT